MCYTVDTRYYEYTESDFAENEDFAEFVKDTFEGLAITDGYCKVSNPTLPDNKRGFCSSSGDSDIAWKWDFYFNDENSGNFDMAFGTDFGDGWAVYLDGAYYDAAQGDWWWNRSWDDEHVIYINFDYEAGDHHMIFYGFENCCDGDFDMTYTITSNEPVVEEEELELDLEEEEDNYYEGDDVESTAGECDVVTIYSECDYAGESMTILEDTECLTW